MEQMFSVFVKIRIVLTLFIASLKMSCRLVAASPKVGDCFPLLSLILKLFSLLFSKFAKSIRLTNKKLNSGFMASSCSSVGHC